MKRKAVGRPDRESDHVLRPPLFADVKISGLEALHQGTIGPEDDDWYTDERYPAPELGRRDGDRQGAEDGEQKATPHGGRSYPAGACPAGPV